VIVQIVIGTLVPIALLAALQVTPLDSPAGPGRPIQAARRTARTLRRRLVDARLGVYVAAGILTLIGIFAMRWNVVIGGQLFSKSFLGYTTYKMEFASREGLLPAVVLMLLPFAILAVLVRVLPPWTPAEETVSRQVSV
jgi:hypothetical protein